MKAVLKCRASKLSAFRSEDNNSGRKIEKTKEEDVPVIGNYNRSRKNDFEKKKSVEGQKKNVCTGKEMS